MKKLILFLFVSLFFPACTQDFSKPRYKGYIYKDAWHRKKTHTWETGTFHDNNVKKNAKRKMLRPRIFNFDTW